jgi:hypothetical protein
MTIPLDASGLNFRAGLGPKKFSQTSKSLPTPHDHPVRFVSGPDAGRARAGLKILRYIDKDKAGKHLLRWLKPSKECLGCINAFTCRFGVKTLWPSPFFNLGSCWFSVFLPSVTFFINLHRQVKSRDQQPSLVLRVHIASWELFSART